MPVGRFNEIGADRELCAKCGRGAKAERAETYIPGGYTKRLLVVFEKPPTSEEAMLLRTLTQEAGYTREDFAWISAVRCGDTIPSMEQLRCCRPFVLRALDWLQPKAVLALGPSASRTLTNLGTKSNVTKLRGRPLEIAGRAIPAYGTYPPSSVLAGGSQYRVRILEDLRRFDSSGDPYPADDIPMIGVSLSVDTEYAPDNALLTIGVADNTHAASAEVTEPDFETLCDRIQASPDNTVLVGHSLSGDVDHLVALGLARESWVSGESTLDSLLLARMADENRGKGGYDLEGLLTSDHNVEPWKKHTEAYSKTDATVWPVELRRERCRLDAWASHRIVGEYYAKVTRESQPIVLTHRIAMSLHRVELAGVYVDRMKFEATEAELRSEQQQYKDRLTKKAHAHGIPGFNPTNDDDIRELLFKKLKLEVVKTTKKEKLASVDKTTLKQYVGTEEVDLLLKFNAADKALSTNIIGVTPMIQPVSDQYGYLPVHINPLGARTGRRSSERPNMQNWSEKMRQMVVSRYLGGSILEFDYKSLEVFLLAFAAHDDKLYDYFAHKGGYIAVAKEMWNTEVIKGSTEYRATKSVVLGTNYNMQTGLMAENLWFMGVKFSEDYDEHEQKTDKLRNAYLDMFPGLRRFMKAQKGYLLQYECAKTLTGRVRHLQCPQGRNTPGFGRLVNQAINYPIQGLAAEVTGSALIDCEAALCEQEGLTLLEYHTLVLTRGWTARPIPLIINEVHDNLLFDLPWGAEDPRTVKTTQLLKTTMEAVTTLRELVPSFTVPLKVSTKIGPHWGMPE